jgi:hypothetical protein
MALPGVTPNFRRASISSNSSTSTISVNWHEYSAAQRAAAAAAQRSVTAATPLTSANPSNAREYGALHMNPWDFDWDDSPRYSGEDLYLEAIDNDEEGEREFREWWKRALIIMLVVLALSVLLGGLLLWGIGGEVRS